MRLLLFIIFFFYISDVSAKTLNKQVIKPTGIFSTYSKESSVLSNKYVNGFLITIKWNQLEKKEGEYDFSIIDSKVKNIKKHNKFWSLAVLAGPHSPKYLKRRAEFFLYNSSKGAKIIPKYWDGDVQESIRRLMVVLARRYNNDSSLKLVYVPQMSANGIEAHFKAIKEPYKELYDIGFTKKRWIEATVEATINTAKSFYNKAIAIEVREIVGDSEPTEKILRILYNDERVGKRVGAAIWWLSDKTDYQKSIFNLLTTYEGDIYAHISGRSDQDWKFGYKGYHYLFWQAREIGARYLEVNHYELKNKTSDNHLRNFNKSTAAKFNQKKKRKSKILDVETTK